LRERARVVALDSIWQVNVQTDVNISEMTANRSIFHEEENWAHEKEEPPESDLEHA
jgi:hypothetical protein